MPGIARAAGPAMGLLLPLGALIAAAQVPRAANAPGLELFETRIRPLLVGRCYSCHSASNPPAKGGLLLDTAGGTLKGGAHGKIIVAGQPERSALIRAVGYSDPKLQMPPNGKLSDAEIGALTEWVRVGAPDPRGNVPAPARTVGMSLEAGRRYWAYLPLRKTAPPVAAAESQPSWVRTPVDSFVLAGLRHVGLKPNPRADRRTYIRRAYFDLLGLPPSPEQVRSFVEDRSPDPYGKLIDSLLANLHYGERWARHWLDLARFAESHGYEQDYDRPNAYQYRDFVIKALNSDMPYDQFVKWQLAGDEFAPDNPLALMATGFLAAGTHATQITKNQVEKERYDELDDMLSTTGTCMLGLTFGCARCHDHKYDPIPTRDYYRLLATFTTTVRSDFDVDMDPARYRAERAAFETAHAPLVEAERRLEREELPARMDRWLKERPATAEAPGWIVPEVVSAKSAGGASTTTLEDGSVLLGGPNPDTETLTFVEKTALTGITAIRLEALTDPSLSKGGPGRAPNGNFALSDFRVTAASAAPNSVPAPVVIAKARATFEQKGLPVAAAIDGDPKSAWAVDPQVGKDQAAVFELVKPVGFEGGTVLTITMKFENNTGHGIGRPRISLLAGADAGISAPSKPERVAQILRTACAAPLSDADRRDLLSWYRTTDPEWQRLHKAIQDHLAAAPKPQIQKALISSEGVTAVRTHTQGGDFLPETYFLKRGDPNQKQGVATAGFLTVLERSPESEGAWRETPPDGWHTSYRRRSFANWIVDTDRGAGALLARVIVNRLWQHHMGRGIVATPSDFGVQGEKPSNPELLDWLASELIRNGWKLKPIHRLIMTSAAYMQSSASNDRSARVDPENRLCWRHPRQRLEAEIIRDSMLSVAGLLDGAMYGPGTLDESMKRRSIYFFVKRSKLIPSLALFDAPNALLGIGSRSVTTVAPQALMLMNSPHVREYAVAFAGRLSAQAAGAPDQLVRAAFLQALGRSPDAREAADSLAFLKSQGESYRASHAPDPEGAALADLCQALMGLNEFMYVD